MKPAGRERTAGNAAFVLKGGKSNIKRTKTGVFTAEGNVAGGRAGRLAAKRLKEQEEYAKQRQKLADKHAKGSVKSISSKFTKTSNKKELVFKTKTIGLTTVEEYREAKAGVYDLGPSKPDRHKAKSNKAGKRKKKKKKRKRKAG